MSMVTKYSIRGINPKHNIPHIFIGDVSRDGLDILEGNSCSFSKIYLGYSMHTCIYIISIYSLTSFNSLYKQKIV